MNHRDAHLINGRWQAAKQPGAIAVVNPYTEAEIARVPEATAEEVDQAVQAARAAFPAWSSTSREQRGALLEALYAELKSRERELAELISAEVGTPLKLCQRMQVPLPLNTVRNTAELLKSLETEERLNNSVIVHEPVGVVACIAPWNYPLNQLVAKAIPAMAAGCTVVAKPSEITPLNAYALAEAIVKVGFPPGVFNMVIGRGPTVGEALVRHRDVDMVSFTGSTAAGRRVAAAAAETVKRVALELGGKSPSIILDDADLPSAVKSTVNMCFLNSGQTCTALTRMLVPASRYEEAAQIAAATAKGFVLGDPADDKTRLGPLTTSTQRERVRAYLRKGIEEGATLVCGGPDAPVPSDKGWFVAPTVFGKVDPKSTIAQEEIFGPVLSIITYDNDDDAVRIANDSIYGLAAAVWSADDARAQRVARRVRAGQIDINGGPFNPLAPFGGFKQSGIGREFGRFGLEEFLEPKSLQLKPAS
jgi:aldehyde dehydrogenase (NAD+)